MVFSATFNHRRMGHGFRFLLPLFSTTRPFSKFSYKSFLFQNFHIRVFCVHSFSTVSVEKLWTQNTRIIHDVWRLLILSNEEKTNDYENFEKGMNYMKILKKKGVVEKKGEEETKSMPHAPVYPTYAPLSDPTEICNLHVNTILSVN